MKTKLIAMLMAAGSTMFAGPRVFVGVGIGAPVVPAPIVAPAPILDVAYVPPCPTPGFLWTAGYYNYFGGRRVWVPGYWHAPIGAARFDHRVAGRNFDRGYARGFRR